MVICGLYPVQPFHTWTSAFRVSVAPWKMILPIQYIWNYLILSYLLLFPSSKIPILMFLTKTQTPIQTQLIICSPEILFSHPFLKFYIGATTSCIHFISAQMNVTIIENLSHFFYKFANDFEIFRFWRIYWSIFSISFAIIIRTFGQNILSSARSPCFCLPWCIKLWNDTNST